MTCAYIEDSDQPALPRSLIRVFDSRFLSSEGSNASSGIKLRLLSDCTDAQTDSIIRCTHMPNCTLCWIRAQLGNSSPAVTMAILGFHM